MERVRLGRTGLPVSRMGVGAGGASQIGKRTGLSEAESVALLRRAFDAGVNQIDTSENYGTEEIVGRALREHGRDGLVVSTKKATKDRQITPQTVADGIDGSLRRLGVECIDVYHLHGVMPEDYRRIVDGAWPALERARQAGKIRFVGVTEMYNSDREHRMARLALADDLWDVMMIGFSAINQTARHEVLTATRAQDVGVQVMFAVRKALSTPDNLREFVEALVARGEIAADDAAAALTLGAAMPDGARSLPDAAYRFCRAEPGVHVVLSGTGNAAHLEANLASFDAPPLPQARVQEIRRLFADVRSTTGQAVPT